MDKHVKAILSGEINQASAGIKKFLQLNEKCFSFTDLQQAGIYPELWKVLTSYLVNPDAKAVHIPVLNVIRILGRDKNGLDDVMTEELLNTLNDVAGIKAGEYVTNPAHFNTALESAKCLCNLIFNSKVASTMCCNNGTLEGITSRLKKSKDIKPPGELFFFDVKILFIISALSSKIRPKLKNDLHGLEYLIDALDILLEDEERKNEKQDIDVNTACEILKTLFNLTLRQSFIAYDDEEEVQLLKLVNILRKLLIVKTTTLDRKHELVNHVINLLTNMPNSALKNIYVPINGRNVSEQYKYDDMDLEAIYEILEFLKRTLNKEPGVNHQHELLSPIFSSLLRFATVDRPVRKYLRQQILPPLKDVSQRPEQGSTLRNGLCRLLTTPITQVRDFAAELLFVLCKENVNRMIKYTGYGNAAGLFARRGLLGGRKENTSAYSSDSDDSDTEEYRDMKHGINPVLGCYQAPQPNPTAGMTEEQKEYEAMKLVQLMDNLTRAGVVKPCRIGSDGKPQPVEHVLELQAYAEQLHRRENNE